MEYGEKGNSKVKHQSVKMHRKVKTPQKKMENEKIWEEGEPRGDDDEGVKGKDSLRALTNQVLLISVSSK